MGNVKIHIDFSGRIVEIDGTTDAVNDWYMKLYPYIEKLSGNTRTRLGLKAPTPPRSTRRKN